MELLEAVKRVLEWHDEDAWDNVQRESVIDSLREAYEAAQQSVQADGATCWACHKNTVAQNRDGWCEHCGSPRR